MTLYRNFLSGNLEDDPDSSTTTLESSAFDTLPVIADPDTMWLTLDPEAVNGAPEIVKVTAHTASATSVTVDRGEQSTTARAHPTSGGDTTEWRAAVTRTDFEGFRDDPVPLDTVTAAGSLIVADGSASVDELAVGSDGEILVADSGESLGTAWKGGMVEIDEKSPSSGTSISFQDIPTDYSHLKIVGRVQHDDDSGSNSHRQFRIRFNNDSGSNYEGMVVYWEPGGTDGDNVIADDTGATSGHWGYLGDVSSGFEITIPDYRDASSFKSAESFGTSRVNPGASSTNWRKFVGTALWEANTAISRVDLIFSGGTDEFADALVTLYGLG